MNRLQRLIRNWLGFSRTEINGFLVLLPLMIILIFSEPVYRWWVSHRKISFAQDEKKLDSLIVLWRDKKPESTISEKTSLFVFNPNYSSPEELQSLGFSKNLSTRIAHYRQKGGKFRVKSDLLKLYGMDSTFYHQLYAYI